jgi:glycolate oxidase
MNTTATILGQEMRLPVFMAPIGGMHILCPDAVRSAMEAASEFNTLFWLGSVNLYALEAAAEAEHRKWVFQLYVQGDENWLFEYLERINRIRPAGFCLTVDTAVYSRRERDLWNRYTPTGREKGEREGFSAQSEMTWDLVKKVRERLEVPLILKGIQTAEDADLAASCGVDAVYVSNHGGRQLDHGLGAMDVLAEVVSAVGDRASVYVDGGFVRGSDVVKALALGAKAVGIGKLHALALAADGKQGLLRVLEILETEIRISMGLLGVTGFDQLDATYVQTAQPVKHPTYVSPFPSLQEKMK